MDSAYNFTKKKIRSVLLANIKKITILFLIVCYLIKNCFNLIFFRRFQCIGEFLSGRQNNKTNPGLIHLTSDDLLPKPMHWPRKGGMAEETKRGRKRTLTDSTRKNNRKKLQTTYKHGTYIDASSSMTEV